MTEGPRLSAEGQADQRQLDGVLDAIGPLDTAAMDVAAARLDRLTKPPGSLGQLETLVIELAGITGRADATAERGAVVVAAGDHGVARQGVSAYPSDVTAQMVANFVAGGAAINVLGAWAGVSLVVVDAGVASPIPVVSADPVRGGRLVRARIRDGTADMTEGPAMSRAEALRAVATGIDLAGALWADGLDLLGVGEMGIGNTTAASALTAALTGADPAMVTGRGTGVTDEMWVAKVEAVRRALAVNRPDAGDAVGVLAALGGFEIAGLVGVVLAGAARRVPVVLDGFIASAAALVAARLAPAARSYMIAAHRSAEPGHARVLEALGIAPYLDLGMRLGEGTGAALGIGLLRAALACYREMATFKEAGVSERLP
jgi:nicotinate-nucleotide--dimethylbenzimidazole phosphoribosyltransferase